MFFFKKFLTPTGKFFVICFNNINQIDIVNSMGRAFPRLLHYLPFINESAPMSPAVMADWRGNCEEFSVKDVPALEEAMRGAVVKLGGAAAIAFPPIDAQKVSLVSGSVSRAWRIGHALLAAHGTKDPIQVYLFIYLFVCLFGYFL